MRTRRHGRRLASLLAILLLLPGAPGRAQEFGPPAPLHADAATDTANDFYPAAATDRRGTWLAAWMRGSDVVVVRSADNAGSWSPPASLGSPVQGFRPDVVADGSGTFVVAWEAQGGTGPFADRDILFARSTDGGVTGAEAMPLDAGAPGDTRRDAAVRLATDGAGTWLAVWYACDPGGPPPGPDCDLLVARSSDGGATWGPPVPLNADAFADAGDDHDPAIATDGAGTWLVAWSRSAGAIGTESDVLVARSSDAGLTWTPPALVDAAAVADTGRDEEVVLAVGGGTWVVAWATEGGLGGTLGSDRDVLVARSLDGGSTWSVPGPLNTTGAADTGHDYQPHVATDGAGTWLAAWWSEDSLGGTIGQDGDVLVARSDDAVAWSAPAPLEPEAATDGPANPDLQPRLVADGAGTWVAFWASGQPGPLLTETDIALARGAVCGDARQGAAETCDDGNRAAGDCCGAGCQVEPGCCDPVARAGCRTAGLGALRLADRKGARRDRLAWTWRRGAATAVADLGDPAGTTDWVLCLFRGSPRTLALQARAPHGAAWKAAGARGIRYASPRREPDGLREVVVRAGEPGKARAAIAGSGPALHVPALPLAAPVLVQLQASNGTCLETSFAEGMIKRNSRSAFRAIARSP